MPTKPFGAPDGEARTNTAPTELSSQNQSSYGFVTKVTNALLQSGYTQYDYHIGKPVDGEDPNGVVASGFYSDSLDRPTQVIRGNQFGSSLTAQTSFSYNDGGRTITTTSDQNTFGDNVLGGTLFYDGLGRTIETHKSEGGGFIVTSKKTFDALGRLLRSYNPYRTSSDSTYGYADTVYDALSRPLTVTTFDQFRTITGVVQTGFSGNQVTVTDQAGKSRQSTSDALGRLTGVVEDPTPGGLNYSTSYGYDVLDDLTSVTQGTQPARTFNYDSLKRLTSANNPESGPVSYPLYDENGNLIQKIDARGVKTNYTYDVLNRVTSRSYQGSPATPAVSLFYDNTQNLPAGAPNLNAGSSVGRLVAVTYGGGAAGTYQGYDTFGRETVSYQQTSVQSVMQTYQMGYGYDLSGAMTSETYPSGKIANTAYDAAGRVTTVSKQGGGNYASGITYAPQGAMNLMTLGNTLIEQTMFNSRLQPTTIELGVSTANPQSVLGLIYIYNTQGLHDNNGNVLSQTINGGSTQIGVQTYTYDAINRLQSATEGAAWSQFYDYDQYGNRAVRSGSQYYIPNPTLTPQSANATDFSAFDQMKNQIKSTLGFQYDPAGNVTGDPNTGPNNIAYDAENRQTSYTRSTTVTGYGYDGEGRRVTKSAGGVTTVFVYNIGGQLIAEYGGAASNGGTSYLTTDHLGSTRVVTDSNKAVIARHDYLPFGEEIPAGIGGNRTMLLGYVATDDTRQRFTSKERDNESGLDYFASRYYSGAEGRFTSPDPKKGFHDKIVSGRGWNLYIYVNNSPLSLFDPDGLADNGSGGGKTIDIFIALEAKDFKPGNTHQNFAGLQAYGKKHGYTINVHNYDESTFKNVSESLQQAHMTLIDGHGVYQKGDPEKKAFGIKLKDAVLTNQGHQMDFFGVKGAQVATAGRLESQAAVVGLFGCNTTYMGSPVNAPTGSWIVSINSGPEGETSAPGMTASMAAFLVAYIKSDGDIFAAKEAGTKALETGDPNEPLNKGDFLSLLYYDANLGAPQDIKLPEDKKP